METIFKPGDVFLTRGKSILSKAIRFFSRTIGESRTQVNHVGLVTEAGDIRNCMVVEALKKVVRHSLWSKYGPENEDAVAVYRPLNLDEEEIQCIVEEAEEQVKKTYGYFKIAAHLLDWCLLGAYLFRRMAGNGNYPICSWLVAHAFAKAGKDFGCPAGAAEPDDIWDFIQSHRDKYQEIHALKRIWLIIWEEPHE